jgi:hypothetical protein
MKTLPQNIKKVLQWTPEPIVTSGEMKRQTTLQSMKHRNEQTDTCTTQAKTTVKAALRTKWGTSHPEYINTNRITTYETCRLMATFWTLTSATFKSRSNKNLCIISCTCILIRYTYEKNLELIQPYSNSTLVFFQDGHLADIFEVRSGQNLVER